ncbi:hypothetical protein R1flu_024307 [Riccia fluitans]|uniref:Uncharacterized protein n=1 Tax=Riccia fluitans TaxID=41844 RepID=A0ABD1XUI7_9MARC
MFGSLAGGTEVLDVRSQVSEIWGLLYTGSKQLLRAPHSQFEWADENLNETSVKTESAPAAGEEGNSASSGREFSSGRVCDREPVEKPFPNHDC